MVRFRMSNSRIRWSMSTACCSGFLIATKRMVGQVYSLLSKRDLFGQVKLMRNWRQVGTNGRGLAEDYALVFDAGQALEARAFGRWRRGYYDLWSRFRICREPQSQGSHFAHRQPFGVMNVSK